jgi:hypothetical protein
MHDLHHYIPRASDLQVLLLMLRSWTGVLCLTSDPHSLRSLIGVLALPDRVKGAAWAKVMTQYACIV